MSMKLASSVPIQRVSTSQPEPRHLDRALEAMLGPLRLPGGLPLGWQLGQIDVDQGVTLLVYNELSGDLQPPRAALPPLVIELDQRNPDRPCFAHTEQFNISYSEVQGARERLSDEELLVMAAIIACVRQGEQSLVPTLEVARERWPTRGQRREITVDHLLMRDEQSSWYINPYVGCTLGCCFCYASHRGAWSRSLQGLGDLPWGSWVDIKVNAAAVLAHEIGANPRGVVRLSPVITDPYQGLERKYEITRQCLQVIQPTALEPMVLTRSPLVLRDLELLQQCRHARVGFSVPTEDDAIRQAVEPGTAPIAERIHALAQLKAAGIETFAMIRPILVRDPAALARLLAPVVRVVEIGPLQEKSRIARELQAIDYAAPLDDAWQEAQFHILQRALANAGVAVNPREPPWCNT